MSLDLCKAKDLKETNICIRTTIIFFSQASTSSSADASSVLEDTCANGLELIVQSCPNVTRFELINGGLKQTVIQSGKSKPGPSDYKPWFVLYLFPLVSVLFYKPTPSQTKIGVQSSVEEDH